MAIWHDTKRLYHRKLVVPLLRGKHPPEYLARSVLIGLVVAMTPTVGVQMPICLLLWALFKAVRPQWDFNAVVAMAWTWVTNVFTLGPIYYLFLVTGRVMTGHWDSLTGYQDFVDRLNASQAVEADWLTTLWVYVVSLFQEFGAPMFIGSIPWAILCGWLGYRWSLGFTRRIELRRAQRKARRAERLRGESGA
ncbi:MAG: DUF2062 domain-containing protein [Gammaproteobacteria bacterium]